MQSSLLKQFAAHFYRYRAWLIKQPLNQERKDNHVRYVNHYLAYLTLSQQDHRQALANLQKRNQALRAYRLYLRRTAHFDCDRIDEAQEALDHFYRFIGLTTPKEVNSKLAQLADRRPKLGASERSWLIAKPSRKLAK